jgi:predicted AlkP superfamily phosphohydrolase/phosphomutase
LRERRAPDKDFAMKRLAIIGLDCAAPALVFDRFAADLPNLRRLMDAGSWGPLLSCDPPITVPAWSCMTASRDAGQLGFYGFRNRGNYSYEAYQIADSRSVRVPRLWEILSQAGHDVIVHGVPQTYPVTPVRGAMVSCFLTPSTKSQYTYPAELKPIVEQVAGGYVLDVEDFRTDDKRALLGRIHDKTAKHFKVARHLLTTQPWQFFMMVEMGVDRVHHGFWRFMDPANRNYQPGNPLEDSIREYYRAVDREVGEVLALIPSDCAVMVVSDHGAKSMEGGVCVNEWLIEHGYLTLKEYPNKPTPITAAAIDWDKTRAWGDGGYYARIFLNVRGREPQGTIAAGDYEAMRSQLAKELEAICDAQGRPLGTRALRPQDIYREVGGVAPDLIVYFGDLNWRSVGSVGLGNILTYENDTGPDDANHDYNGIFILDERGSRPAVTRGRVEGRQLYDVAPTALRLMGLEPLPGMIGRSWV